MKKIGLIYLEIVILTLILQTSLISSINLDIIKKEISSTSILELNKPAIFELTLINKEAIKGEFYIYSLISGIDLEPKQSFEIEGNGTKRINISIYPREARGYFSFEYKIRDNDFNIQTDNIAINSLNLKNTFKISSDNLVVNDEKAVIYFENRANHEIKDIDASFSSSFFEYKEKYSFSPAEKKRIEIPIDKEKTKELLAGPYIIRAVLNVAGNQINLDSVIRFMEKEDIKISDITEGIFIRRQEIIKSNIGNIPSKEEVVIKRNILAGWFTTFNIPPTNKDSVGFNTFYIFEKTIDPGQELKVIARTNWVLFAIVVIATILIIIMSIKYSNCKLKVSKKATYVKTKGGEFALKISIILKAREFVERINVVDKIPAMVKVYERYGTISPDRVDRNNKRIEWNIGTLNKGEERVMSYIIYSKIGVIGKFELPEADVIYEYNGKIKESTSNKSFFINEPGHKKSSLQRE